MNEHAIQALHDEIKTLREEVRELAKHMHIGNGKPGLTTRIATVEQSLKVITWLASSATIAALAAIAHEVINKG